MTRVGHLGPVYTRFQQKEQQGLEAVAVGGHSGERRRPESVRSARKQNNANIVENPTSRQKSVFFRVFRRLFFPIVRAFFFLGEAFR